METKFEYMRKYIVLILSLFFTLIANAQVKNYLGVWADAGENSMLTRLTDGSALTSGGVGFGIGGGYEMHAGRFVLNTGLEAGITWSSFSVPDSRKELTNVLDDEGDNLDFVFIQGNRKDSYTNLSFQIPVMIGAQVNNFYFLAGMKMGMSIYGSSRVKADISSAGDYEKFIDEFIDMPEHLFYSNMPFSKKGSVKFNPSLSPSIEIGYVFGEFSSESGFDVPKHKNIYRIGFFADYEVLNMVDKGTKESLTLPESFNLTDMSSGIDVNNILSTKERTSSVNGFSVGVKFTIMFGLKDRKSCVICSDK